MRSRNGSGLGTVTLVMLFSVLCLCVFALLSLSTAKSELNLSERYAESIEGYYAADTAAVRVFQAIAEGDVDTAKANAAVLMIDNTSAEFSVPIDDALTLEVILKNDGGSWIVEKWCVAATGDWNADESIDVWDGL